MDAVGVQRSDGTTRRGPPETDDHSAEAAAVIAGGTSQCQCMQHRAVAGELVVLVEDVQAKAAVARPVVHGLKGDERELLVDGKLGDSPVLYAVRPAPQRLPVTEFGQILGLRLGGEEDDVVVGNQLLACTEPPTNDSSLLSGTPNRSP